MKFKNEFISEGQTQIMTNEDGKKFMKKVFELLDNGADITSGAMGRTGKVMLSLDKNNIKVCKKTPSGKISKNKCGMTSFGSGDKVALYDLGNNTYSIKNIIG